MNIMDKYSIIVIKEKNYIKSYDGDFIIDYNIIDCLTFHLLEFNWYNKKSIIRNLKLHPLYNLTMDFQKMFADIFNTIIKNNFIDIQIMVYIKSDSIKITQDKIEECKILFNNFLIEHTSQEVMSREVEDVKRQLIDLNEKITKLENTKRINNMY